MTVLTANNLTLLNSSVFNLILKKQTRIVFKMSFANKVAVVTGSGSGMGEATAILFAKEGADVVIIDRNEETASKTADKCKEYGNRVLVIKADLSKDEEVRSAMVKIIQDFGKLDILINNAGIVKEGTIVSGTILETYDEVMNTNLRSVVVMTCLAAPHLIKTKGSIVNISSIATSMTKLGAQYPAYTLSKAGVDYFTRCSAFELAPFGVRVNSIRPGPVRTNIFTNLGDKFEDFNVDEYAIATALNKCSEPDEIANLILYLTSDKAKSITGSSHDLDNGTKLI